MLLVPYDEMSDSLNYLKINGNEMTVFAEKEIFFPIDFTTQSSYINGKIYSLKGSTFFRDSIRNIIGTKKTINDGIISDYNLIRQLYLTQTKGFYCIKSDNIIILSIK